MDRQLRTTAGEAPDLLPLPKLELSDDQADLIRLIARRQRQTLLEEAADMKANPANGRERFNTARLLAGMAEGVVRNAAYLLGDETILDNPDDNL
jgi:hypothetical protein